MIPNRLTVATLALLMFWPHDRAPGQAACPTATGAMRVDTVTGVRASVTGYFPSGAHPSAAPFRFDAFVILVPAPGNIAPARRSLVDTAGAFDLGVIAPGRYLAFASVAGGMPFYGELAVGSQTLSLCLGPSVLNLRPSLTFVSNGPASPIPGSPPSDAEVAAVGDALGRWLAGSRSDSHPMWIGGSEGPVLEAARRGFMIGAGDSILPPMSPPPDRFQSGVRLFSVGLLASDSALVIASRTGCYKSASRASGAVGGSDNGAYVVVRSGPGTDWIVRQYVARFHATLVC